MSLVKEMSRWQAPQSDPVTRLPQTLVSSAPWTFRTPCTMCASKLRPKFLGQFGGSSISNFTWSLVRPKVPRRGQYTRKVLRAGEGSWNLLQILGITPRVCARRVCYSWRCSCRVGDHRNIAAGSIWRTSQWWKVLENISVIESNWLLQLESPSATSSSENYF